MYKVIIYNMYNWYSKNSYHKRFNIGLQNEIHSNFWEKKKTTEENRLWKDGNWATNVRRTFLYNLRNKQATDSIWQLPAWKA